MSKATPFKEQILQLICLFLEQNGQAFIAQQLEAKFQLPKWLSKDNQLLKKGLSKIIKQYVRENKKLNQYFVNRKPNQQSEQEQIPQVIEKPKKQKKGNSKQKQVPQTKNNKKNPSTSAWINGFDQPKLLEDIDQDLTREKNTKITVIKHGESLKPNKKAEKQETAKHKKTKQAKQKKKDQSSEQEAVQSSSQQEQVKPKKKLKVDVKQDKKNRKGSKQLVQANKKKLLSEPMQQQNHQKNNLQTRDHTFTKRVSTPGQAFTRINKQDVLPVCQARRDNSFEAKFKYGGGDQWGRFGHQKLKDTRGDSFKKTKGKLKNNAFQAAGIDVNRVNSIKII